MQTRQRETFRIGGMSCSHCTNAVREALKRISGVDIVTVQTGAATVAYDPDHTDRHAITAAIEGAGYAVEVQRQA